MHETLLPKGQELVNSDMLQIMQIVETYDELFNEKLMDELELYSSNENMKDVRLFLSSFLSEYNPVI